MDFFQHQDQALRHTRRLILLFLATVVALIGAIYLAVMAVFGGPSLWRPDIFAGVVVVTVAVVAQGSLSRMAQLRGGGSVIAERLGGRRLDPTTGDTGERRALNIVEEMALASGMTVPPVYLLPDEAGINAFAAGHGTADAVIGVTRGAVEHLTRDELQGVIAHEFSHIINGDMRLNVRLMGVIHGILVIALVGRVLFHLGVRSRKNGAALGFVGLALLVIGGVGVFFGRLIKSGVSRQREFLADASAVQFTRNPLGISGALQKIGGLAAGSRIGHARAEEASHMFFGNGLKKSWLGWTSTHPPLAERIRRIDPSFSGPGADVEGVAHPGAEPAAAGFTAAGSTPVSALVERVGALTGDDVGHAQSLIEALPQSVVERARDPHGAEALIFATLITREGSTREGIGFLDEDRALAERVDRAVQELGPVPATSHLPLLELAMSALSHLTEPEYDRFLDRVRALVVADAHTSLFEYAVQRVLAHHRTRAVGAKNAPVMTVPLRVVRAECATLLGALARAGAESETEAQTAFLAGIAALRLDGRGELPTPETLDLRTIDRALDRLARLDPRGKRQLLDAMLRVAEQDGVVLPDELDLLRVVSLALEIPIPLTVGLQRS